MKWKSGFLWILLLLTVGCIDVYEGETRYVIEGTFLDGADVVAYEEVRLFSKKSNSNNEEIYNQPIGELFYISEYSIFSKVTTDSNGNFRLGFPGGDDWVFYIKVRDKIYGYFSYRNMPDYYYNMGEISIKEEE